MNLRQIKNDLESLCGDLLDELPADITERVQEIKRSISSSDQWIVKTEHLQLAAVKDLWAAMRLLNFQEPETRETEGKLHQEVRWKVNQSDGRIEEALRIDTEERSKGVPKPLRSRTPSEEDTEFWLELVQESEEFISNKDLYDQYVAWMKQESPGSEPLSIVALGRRLSLEGFEPARAKIDGVQVRGWRLKSP